MVCSVFPAVRRDHCGVVFPGNQGTDRRCPNTSVLKQNEKTLCFFGIWHKVVIYVWNMFFYWKTNLRGMLYWWICLLLSCILWHGSLLGVLGVKIVGLLDWGLLTVICVILVVGGAPGLLASIWIVICSIWLLLWRSRCALVLYYLLMSHFI